MASVTRLTCSRREPDIQWSRAKCCKTSAVVLVMPRHPAPREQTSAPTASYGHSNRLSGGIYILLEFSVSVVLGDGEHSGNANYNQPPACVGKKETTMDGLKKFRIDTVLSTQCEEMCKAADAGLELVRRPDMAQSLMMDNRTLALQQFVLLGLHGIEGTLKVILNMMECKIPIAHTLWPLFQEVFSAYAGLQQAMGDEYAFWKDTAQHIADPGRFLHHGKDFRQFIDALDDGEYHNHTRYMLVTDHKGVSDAKIEHLLAGVSDPRLLGHLWRKLILFLDQEFFYTGSRENWRGWEHYFRWYRLVTTGMISGKSTLVARYMKTGKAEDFIRLKTESERLAMGLDPSVR